MNPIQPSAAAIFFAAQQAQINQNNANNSMNNQAASSLNAGGVFQQQQLQLQLQQQFQPLADNSQGSQQSNFSNELKLLQQLQREIGNQNSNALLLPNSNRMNESPHQQAAALLQSVLDHRVRNQRLETPLSQNFMGIGGINAPLLQGNYLNDARLLLSQPNQFAQQNFFGGQLPIQTADLFSQQSLQQRTELPLPSPHALFHRDGTKRMRGGVIEPFPEKLHRLLTEVEAAGRSDVISFVASGRAFAIHKPDKFFKEIVPLYFRQSRLSSFKRQLNLYGFELINTGPARGGYYHEMFIKDQPETCRRMRRVAVKVGSTGKRDESGDLEKGSSKGEKNSKNADADDDEEDGEI